MSRTTAKSPPKQRLVLRSPVQEMIQIGALAGVERAIAEQHDPMLKLQRRLREVDWDVDVDSLRDTLAKAALSQDEEE